MKAVAAIVMMLAAMSAGAADIMGKVTDAASGKGVAGVDVRIRADDKKVADLLTNAGGDYKAVRLRPQTLVLTFMRNGFQPHPFRKEVELKEGVTTLNIILVQEAQNASYYQEVATRMVLLSTVDQRKEIESGIQALPERDQSALRQEVAAIDQTVQRYASEFEKNGYRDFVPWLRTNVVAGKVDIAANQLSFSFPAAFQPESASLKRSVRTDITKLASTVSRFPNAKVTILGYTDATGSEDYNVKLSNWRAESVGQLFENHDVGQVYAVGKGMANYQYLGLPPNDPALRSVVVVLELKDPM